MKQIISLRDLAKQTVKTYKKHFKKMNSVLGVILLLNILPILIEVIATLGMATEETLLSGGAITLILFIILAFIAYIALLVASVILTVGFVKQISNIDQASMKVKEVWNSGKKLFKPTIYLALRTMLVSISLLAVIFVPVFIIVGITSFLPDGIGGIIASVAMFAGFIGIFYFGAHIAFSQLALYIDDKKGLDPIEYSVKLVQGNILNLFGKAFVYYVGILIAMVIVTLGLGFLQEILLQVTYGVQGSEAVQQLIDLQAPGVVMIELAVTIIAAAFNVFVIVPLTMIAAIILYRNLKEVQRQLPQQESREESLLTRDRSLFVPKLYQASKWVILVLVIIPLLVAVIGLSLA